MFIVVLLAIFLLITLFLFLLIYTFVSIYDILDLILSNILNEKIAIFVSLFLTLSLCTYLPDKLGMHFLNFLSKFNKKFKLSRFYSIFVKSIKIKSWVYLIAFIFTFISSLELIYGKNIIDAAFWLEIKPYILQVVVAFIAFDRFVKIFKDEIGSILNNIKNIKGFIKDILIDIFRNSKGDAE